MDGGGGSLATKSCSNLITPGQAPLSMGFPRHGYWSELPFPSPGDLPNPEVEFTSPAWQADSLPPEPPKKPFKNSSRTFWGQCLIVQ